MLQIFVKVLIIADFCWYFIIVCLGEKLLVVVDDKLCYPRQFLRFINYIAILNETNSYYDYLRSLLVMGSSPTCHGGQ